jgi:hypothetical protein
MRPGPVTDAAEDRAALEGLEPLMSRLRARARALEVLLTQRASQRGRFAWAAELRRVREDIAALLDTLNDVRAARGRAEDVRSPEAGEPVEPLGSGSDSAKGLVPTSR